MTFRLTGVARVHGISPSHIDARPIFTETLASRAAAGTSVFVRGHFQAGKTSAINGALKQLTTTPHSVVGRFRFESISSDRIRDGGWVERDIVSSLWREWDFGEDPNTIAQMDTWLGDRGLRAYIGFDEVLRYASNAEGCHRLLEGLLNANHITSLLDPHRLSPSDDFFAPYEKAFETHDVPPMTSDEVANYLGRIAERNPDLLLPKFRRFSRLIHELSGGRPVEINHALRNAMDMLDPTMRLPISFDEIIQLYGGVSSFIDSAFTTFYRGLSMEQSVNMFLSDRHKKILFALAKASGPMKMDPDMEEEIDHLVKLGLVKFVGDRVLVNGGWLQRAIARGVIRLGGV